MGRYWPLVLAGTLLAALPAAAQQTAPVAPITVRIVPREVVVNPAAAPITQPWTSDDLNFVRPDQTFAELRRRFTSQIRFRHAGGAPDLNRALFVPGAAQLGGHVFNLSFLRSYSGRNTAQLVTIAGHGSQGQCDKQFGDFLTASATALGLSASKWQASNALSAGVRSPFVAQDSWSSSSRAMTLDVLRGVFDGTDKVSQRTAPGGARYGVIGPEMIYGTRHALAYAPGGQPDTLTIAIAEFSAANSPVPGQCRLALVRLAPGPVASRAATWTAPTGRSLRRSDMERTRTLAAQYAGLQPAAPGILPPPAPLPSGTIRLDCGIEAEGGTFSGCRQAGGPIAPAAPEPGLQSVTGILQSQRYKSWQFDEDFFGTVPVQVEFTAAPDDLPPVIDWDAVPLQPVNAVSFTRPLRVSGDDYPPRALREELEAIVSLDCVILPDLSPYCGRYLIEPVESVAAFTPVLRTIHRRNVVRRANPLGKDGQTAVGQRYRQRIVFRVPK